MPALIPDTVDVNALNIPPPPPPPPGDQVANGYNGSNGSSGGAMKRQSKRQSTQSLLSDRGSDETSASQQRRSIKIASVPAATRRFTQEFHDPSDPRYQAADETSPVRRHKFTIGGQEDGDGDADAGVEEEETEEDGEKLSPRMLRRKTLSERIRSASCADRELSFTTDRNSEWRAERKSVGQPDPKPRKRNSVLLQRDKLAVWDSDRNECGGVLLKRPLPNSLKKGERKSGWLKKVMRSNTWEPRYFQINTHGVKGVMDADDNYSLRYYSPKDPNRDEPLVDLGLAGARIVKKDPEVRRDHDGKLVFPFEVYFMNSETGGNMPEPLILAATTRASYGMWISTLEYVISVATDRHERYRNRTRGSSANEEMMGSPSHQALAPMGIEPWELAINGGVGEAHTAGRASRSASRSR